MSPTKPTILVVDDSTEDLDTIRHALKGGDEEFTIKISKSGEDALNLLYEEGAEPAIDMILLDINMPGMDGFAVCREIKDNSRTKDIPIIFLTGMEANEAEQRAFKEGAVDFIAKPIEPFVVSARVRGQLALHTRNRSLESLVQKRTEQLEITQQAIVQCLGLAADYRDNDTGNHVKRVSHYCRLIAGKIGMTEDKIDLLFRAAPMHDVGKIGVPDKILLKQGKLDSEEFAIMKRHTTIGGEILGDHDSELLHYAREVALTHHEKWDGSGYPNELKGEAIPLSGRIVAIADVFDALTSVRPYKPAWPVDEAFAEIKKLSGKHFDPGLAEVFLGLRADVLDIMSQFPDSEDASK